MAPNPTPDVPDLSGNATAQKLISRCNQFLNEIQDLTPGHRLEAYLNENYGPGNAYFEDFCKYIRAGVAEGWVAPSEVDSSIPNYRRGRICVPSADNRFCSITAVDMDSDGKDILSGQYHAHPYGEINCVIQLSDGAELKGMQGWQGAGWTSPGPGTHHYPEVRNGRVISLFFLPAGRISYTKNPNDPQPESL